MIVYKVDIVKKCLFVLHFEVIIVDYGCELVILFLIGHFLRVHPHRDICPVICIAHAAPSRTTGRAQLRLYIISRRIRDQCAYFIYRDAASRFPSARHPKHINLAQAGSSILLTYKSSFPSTNFLQKIPFFIF